MGIGCNETDVSLQLADLVVGVRGVTVDVDRAARLAMPACEKGDANACNIAGAIQLLHHHGADAAALALHFFGRACALHDPFACDNLGLLYASGSGVGVDLARAAQLFRESCDAGNARACTHLADLLASDASPAQPIPAASSAPESP